MSKLKDPVKRHNNSNAMQGVFSSTGTAVLNSSRSNLHEAPDIHNFHDSPNLGYGMNQNTLKSK